MLDLERKQDITGDIVFLLQENQTYLLDVDGPGLAVAGKGREWCWVLPSRYECDAPRPAVDITVVTSYILSCWSKPWSSNGFILEKNLS